MAADVKSEILENGEEDMIQDIRDLIKQEEDPLESEQPEYFLTSRVTNIKEEIEEEDYKIPIEDPLHIVRDVDPTDFFEESRENVAKIKKDDVREIYKCKYSCGKYFRWPYQQVNHEDFCQKEPARCAICSKQCRSEQTLRRHILDLHSVTPATRTLFTCDLCDSRFRYKRSLNRHWRTAHAPSRQRSSPASTELQRRTDGKFSCGSCHKSYTRKDALRYHENTVHQGKVQEKLSCEFCSALLATKSSYRKHLKLVHNQSREERRRILNKKTTE